MVAQDAAFAAIVAQLFELHIGGLQTALGFLTGAAHAPAGTVAQPIMALKVHFGIALSRAPPQEGTHIGRDHLIVAHIGHALAPTARPTQARRALVQGHTQGIQKRAFPRPRRPRDGKQARRSQRLHLKVNRKLPRQSGQIFSTNG